MSDGRSTGSHGGETGSFYQNVLPTDKQCAARGAEELGTTGQAESSCLQGGYSLEGEGKSKLNKELQELPLRLSRLRTGLVSMKMRWWFFFYLFQMMFIFSILAGLQGSVNFLLYSKVTQLPLEWISHKILLHSTGNYI